MEGLVYLPPLSPPPKPKPKPEPCQISTESPLPFAGQLRYNINSNLYEVYGNNQWNIITMESKQNG